MGDINTGNQIIRWEYNQNISTQEINQMWVDVINPGVYEGGVLSKISDSSINVSPFTIVFKTANNLLIYCKSQENITVNVNSGTPYITSSYFHSTSKKQYADLVSKPYENIYSTDIILGKCIYSGSVLTGFDYSEKTFGKKFSNDVINGVKPFSVISQTKIDNLNADLLDGYHAGNISGAIPINNDIINNNLNADMVDGCHVSSTPTQNTIPIPISGSLLSSGWLPNTIRGYENPIDTVAYYDTYSQDYELQVGEVAKITFSSTQNVLLRIKVSGTLYKMYIVPGIDASTSGGTNEYSVLFPNNITSYGTSNFIFASHWIQYYSHNTYWANSTNAGFAMGYNYVFAEGLLCTRKESKFSIMTTNNFGITAAYPTSHLHNTAWRDTTTEWTSLGTINFKPSYSGTIYVQRLA